MAEPDIARARAAVLREFRWVGGHADVWRLAENADAFAAVVAGLAALAHAFQPSAIAGIETRGVLFGAPVAHALGLGFHTIRKTDGLFAGASRGQQSTPDYRGRTHTLRNRAAIGDAERVVLVDDWIETGSQADAARALVESAGAQWAGAVVIVDQASRGEGVASLVSASELPPWRGE